MWPHLNAAVSPRRTLHSGQTLVGTVRSRYSLARRGRARASRRNLAMHSCRLRFAGVGDSARPDGELHRDRWGPGTAACRGCRRRHGHLRRPAASATSAPRPWADASTIWPCSSPTPPSSTSAPRRGGLWKTTNSGTTWEVLFDDLDDAVSIGDIAIAPDDANTVWVGTGENNNRQSGSWGNGVYKSIDGGQTWKHMGLRDSKHIARIIVDPDRSRRRLRRRARQPLGTGQGARRLQVHRRRADVDQRAVRQRGHRRHRARAGSVEQQGALRRHLSAAARDVGLQRRRRRAARSTRAATPDAPGRS